MSVNRFASGLAVRAVRAPAVPVEASRPVGGTLVGLDPGDPLG
jgi:hypothetical protein